MSNHHAINITENASIEFNICTTADKKNYVDQVFHKYKNEVIAIQCHTDDGHTIAICAAESSMASVDDNNAVSLLTKMIRVSDQITGHQNTLHTIHTLKDDVQNRLRRVYTQAANNSTFG